MSILIVEDALIAVCKDAVGEHMRQVSSLPSDWDDELINRLGLAAPAVFVGFGGGPAQRDAAQGEAAISGRWAITVATAHASGEEARRRGDALQPGAYELVETLAPLVHNFTIPKVGTTKLESIDNLYTGSVDGKGLAVYVIVLSVPMSFPLVVPAEQLGRFAAFGANYDIPPHSPENHRRWIAGDASGGQPDAADVITLP